MYVVVIGIVLGLLTGVSWGFYPIFAKKQKGTPDNWLLGSCYGMGISSFVILGIVACASPQALQDLNWMVFLLEVITGIAWTVTMIAQFSLIKLIGTAKGLSVANGGKTVMATLFSVFFLGTWLFNAQKIFGFAMIILIVLGVLLINHHNHRYHQRVVKHNKKLIKKTFSDKQTHITWFSNHKIWVYLAVLSFASIAFSQFPSMIDKLQVGSGGWTNPYFSGLIKYIPQAIGAFIGGVSIVYFRARFIFKDMRVFIARSTHRNIIDGFIYASGMICYLYSAFLLNNETNKEIIGGQGIDAGAGATAFALTNFANIVSAFGGIFILKEKFTKHELIYFIAGALVITGAAIMVTFTDSMPFLATWGKTQPIIKSSYIVYPYITP